MKKLTNITLLSLIMLEPNLVLTLTQRSPLHI